MISITDLVGEDALYSKTVSWVSSTILHIDTDTDTDTDPGSSIMSVVQDKENQGHTFPFMCAHDE